MDRWEPCSVEYEADLGMQEGRLLDRSEIMYWIRSPMRLSGVFGVFDHHYGTNYLCYTIGDIMDIIIRRLGVLRVGSNIEG